jgi:UDP-N-acetylmuramate dehydrogenase
LEAGVGIPGSVGAAVVTNAGAHGWEMADSLVSVSLADRAGLLREVPASDLDLRYRGSRLKDWHDHLVLSVRLRLRRDESAAILARIAGFTAARRSSQPRLPSMGSVFKNPPGDHAGRLIEAAGLKGRRRGDAEISSQHANFIVNRGRARASDVLALVALARATVAANCGIQLESEIEVMGVDDVSAAP